MLGRHSLAGALMLLMACGGVELGRGQPRGRAASAERVRGSAVFPAPPVVNGSRVACLDAPYTPGLGATAFADGTPVTMSDDGRSWSFEIAGTRALEPQEASAFLEHVRSRGGALRFVSFGLYCAERACFHLAADLCDGTIDDRRALLEAALVDARGLDGPTLPVSISLGGELGPRTCANGCRPIPYDGRSSFDPEGSRELGPLPEYSGGTCALDDDCMVKGCGNHCVAWQHGGSSATGTCEGYSIEAFCGCVEGQCGWFTQ